MDVVGIINGDNVNELTFKHVKLPINVAHFHSYDNPFDDDTGSLSIDDEPSNVTNEYDDEPWLQNVRCWPPSIVDIGNERLATVT